MVKNRGPIGVLIFPAGEVNSVELHDALSDCVNIRLYGASSYNRHGEYVFKNYITGLPVVTDADFIPAFNKLIDDNNIEVVFPTHDTVAEFLSIHQKEIKAKIIVADAETTEICRDKKKTFQLFYDCDFCPKTYETISQFPVFIKPRKGQGSVGAYKAQSIDEVPCDMDFENIVICEYLPGEEFTVDCITDKRGVLRGVYPRSRERIFAGITVNGAAKKLTDEIYNIAQTINERLHFMGIWYFQIKRDINGKFKLMEISTRCPGTMCLTRALGVNLPLLSIYSAVGRDITVFSNNYNVTVDRTFISRYKIDYKYNRVYMDLDDTLTNNGQVCLNSIRFLYQCYNKNVPVVLLTRHDCDHEDSTEDYLTKCCISKNLFEEIISVPANACKTDYIKPESAIFIDNAFAERKLVHDLYNIPVFDVDGIEVLLDWRK